VVEEDTTAEDEGAAVERLIAAAGEPDATAEDEIVESDVGLTVPVVEEERHSRGRGRCGREAHGSSGRA
jgi:hypothetical protein